MSSADPWNVKCHEANCTCHFTISLSLSLHSISLSLSRKLPLTLSVSHSHFPPSHCWCHAPLLDLLMKSMAPEHSLCVCVCVLPWSGISPPPAPEMVVCASYQPLHLLEKKTSVLGQMVRSNILHRNTISTTNYPAVVISTFLVVN
jgi:hypothetical protein